MSILLRSISWALAITVALGAAATPELPPGRLSFRTYGADRGLSNPGVWHLAQDQRGFVWVGTESGLFRWEGSHFEAFGLKEGLPSSEVLALHLDPQGTLWVGTRSGLARWNGLSFDREPGLAGTLVEGLTTGSDGLWVQSGRGLLRKSRNGTYDVPPGWSGGNVTALFSQPSGQLWVASWAGKAAFHVFHQGTWSTVEAPLGQDKERVDAMVEDGRGRLWARTPKSLWVRDPGDARFQSVTPPLSMVSARGFLNAGRRGDIWVPTDQGIAHLEGDTWTVWSTQTGLPSPWSRVVMEDREGSVWIGSEGLVRLLGRGVWRTYTQVDGLPSNRQWRIFRDRDQTLWAGSDKGLAQATPTGWKVLPGTERTAVRSLVQGADGTLYFAGTPGNEVLTLDPRTRVITRYELGGQIVPKRIFRLMLDLEGMLWVATDGAGLFRADTRRKPLVFESVPVPGGVAKDYFIDIHQDGQGGIWLGAERGLALWKNGQWRQFTTRDGLVRDHVAYIQSTRNGDLLLVYFEPVGMSRVRFEGGSLKMLRQCTTEQGLTENKIYLVGEDARQRVWVGTGRGVDIISPEGIEHFGVMEGLASDDCNNKAFFAEENGDVWIGTSGGLAHFDAKAYRGFPPPPSTELISIHLGKATYLPGQQNLKVPFESNTFSIRFAGMSFLQEDRVQHRVRLLGLESEWTLAEARQARYPSLPHGVYRFEVSSRVGQGQWGPVASYGFEVLPAWWQSWWFRTLLVLGAAAGVLLIIRWRLRALRRQNSLLEEQVVARTRELEVANEALRNQSLTDPLTGLRNRRFLGVCMPDDVAQVKRSYRERETSQFRKDRMLLNIDLIFLMLDLDHFKSVNDEYGHAAGDLVLRQVGAILQEALRDTDTVIRWGGEEFLVVARHACRLDSTALAERLRSQMEAHVFDLGDGRSLRRTCSIGFAYFPSIPQQPEAFSWEQVVDLADQCLYAAKQGGRNAWVGLLPSEDEPVPDSIGQVPRAVPDLLASGGVVVKSSLGDPWEWPAE